MDMKNFPWKYKTAEVPNTEHYAALLDETRTYDSGYGHNGQADMTTDNYMSYYYLGDEAAALEWLREQEEENSRPYATRKSFKIIRVSPVKINRQVSLSLK